MNRPAIGLIRTPDQRLRIFVSSTLRELAPERQAARAAIERMALAPVMFELGARPHPPRSLYRAYLGQSDVFIGIYWESYGWVAPGEAVSGLEDEYNLAPDIPMLIYIKNSGQRDPRLDALLDRIRDDDRVSHVSFASATELRRLLRSDLATLLAERFASGSARGGALLEPAPSPGATTVIRPPTPLARMIGRDDELALVSRMLTEDKRRIVTITGPGGVGKTRLAIAVAREVEAEFPDGVAFVDLAPVRDPELVIDAVASAVGVRDTGEAPLDEKLEFALQGRRMLLRTRMPRMSQGFAPQWTVSPWRSNSPPLVSACSAPPRLRTGSTSRSRCWSTARGIDQSDSARSAPRSSGALNSSSPMSAFSCSASACSKADSRWTRSSGSTRIWPLVMHFNP